MWFLILLSLVNSISLLGSSSPKKKTGIDSLNWTPELYARMRFVDQEADEFLEGCLAPVGQAFFFEYEPLLSPLCFPRSVRSLIRTEHRRRVLKFPKEEPSRAG